MRARIGRAGRATAHLVRSLLLVPACLLALLVFLITLVLCVTFVGLVVLPYTIKVNRWVARSARRQAGRWLGRPVPVEYAPLTGGVLNRAATVLRDRMTRRDLGWTALHLLAGVAIPGLGLGAWAGIGYDLSTPIWWHFDEPEYILWPLRVTAWPQLIAFIPIHLAAVLVLAIVLAPLLATADAWLTRIILATPESVRLAERVAELTETRAAALDAHGAELRRIERDLHDGAQARLVSIAMRLGVAERLMASDPAQAAELVAAARLSTEETMTELRDIIRGMYPPILADRGLSGAVAALAARCPVPVTTTGDGVGRLPAAVEAAAYFVVAEALTNVARHSGASAASIRLTQAGSVLELEVADDGAGGADESAGTGLAGIRRRVAALDGKTRLDSPPGGPTTLRVELPCA